MSKPILPGVVLALVLAAAPAFSACASRPCCPVESAPKLQLPARPDGDKSKHVKAPVYKAFPRAFDKETAHRLLGSFKLDPGQGYSEGPWMRQYRSPGKDSALVSYYQPASEFSYYRRNAPYLEAQEGAARDEVIRRRTDAMVKSLLGAAAETYRFTNVERMRIATDKDLQPRDAYHFGRYLPKVDNRHVLGESFQLRVGYGSRGETAFLSWRNPKREMAGYEKVPSRGAVWDSLARWQRGKTRPECLRYADHPDRPYITRLDVRQIIDSYVEIPEPSTGNPPAASSSKLVPRVTVVASAVLKRAVEPDKNQTVYPLPEPMVMYFHFPCTPSAGFCWPDGQPDISLPSTSGKAIRPAPDRTRPPVDGPKVDPIVPRQAPVAPTAPAAPDAPVSPTAPKP